MTDLSADTFTRKSYFAFTQEEEDDEEDDDVYKDFKTKFSFTSTWKCVSCGSTNVTSISTSDQFAKFQIDCLPIADKVSANTVGSAPCPLLQSPLPGSALETNPSASEKGPLSPPSEWITKPSTPASEKKLPSSPKICSAPFNRTPEMNGIGTRIPGTKDKSNSSDSGFVSQDTPKPSLDGMDTKSGLKAPVVEQREASELSKPRVQASLPITSARDKATGIRPIQNKSDATNRTNSPEKATVKGGKSSKTAKNQVKSKPPKEATNKNWYNSLRNPFKSHPTHSRQPLPESMQERKNDSKSQPMVVGPNETNKISKGVEGTKRKHNPDENQLHVSRDGKNEATFSLAKKDGNTVLEEVAYPNFECPVCYGQFPASQMIAMYCCTHSCCIECTRNYFLGIIREQNILEAVCPVCRKPDLRDEVDMEYFNHLGNQLKRIVSKADYELFQVKLRDKAIQNDPCFKWCEKCDFGYYFEMGGRQLRCPKCNYVVCLQCRKEWRPQHDGNSCEMYAAWLEKRGLDPGAQSVALNNYLARFGIQCPSCKCNFELVKGGCMHFKCTQCRSEFCSGCYRPFKKNGECTFSESCKKFGLHAHHSRACHYYLRDKDPSNLQKLLLASNVEFIFDTPLVATSKQGKSGKCPILEQKSEGQKDEPCGKSVKDKQAGICRKHYIEYLVRIINKNALDPAIIFDVEELRTELAKNKKQIPPLRKGELKENYRRRLVEVIKKEIPLEITPKRLQ